MGLSSDTSTPRHTHLRARLAAYSTREPENGTVNFTYDNVGNPITRTDARGVISCFGTLAGSTCSSGYDSLNRPTHIAYSDGTPSVSYSYDNGASGVNTNNTRGRLLSVANSNSTTSFSSYDPLGHVLASSQTTGAYPARSFSYAYNLFGDLKSETYPSGRVLTSTYDGAERPYSLSGLLGATTTGYVGQAWYWPNGTPFYFTRGGSANLWHVNALNPRMQVSESYESIGNAPGVAAMPFVSCPNWGYHTGVSGGAWDACPHVSTTTDNGNLQGYTEYHGGPGRSSYLTFTQTLGYDNLNRLTSATDSGGWSRNFSYDQFGNMAPSVGSGTNYIALAGNSPTAFNAANNQISGPTGTTYDAAGNQTLVNGNAVAYDAENRTKSLASGAWTYSFDGLGQRVQKTPYSGSSTAYVYDAFGQLAAEYTSGTTWARDYIHWGSSGALIATENASGPCTTCYFGYDHLGSIKIVLDQSANVIGRHDFLPYGEEVPASTAGRDGTFGPTVDTVTTKFTSQLRDAESGMDYFNARNFTAPLGRFMSPDPGNAGADPADPQTWNGYAYVRNSPMHTVDPSGADGFGTDPGEGDPCFEDPLACDPGPVWFPLPSPPPPPPPPTVTEGTGGNPLPPGSFPNGETLGLPPGLSVPRPLSWQSILGLWDWDCSGGVCVPGFGVDSFASKYHVSSDYGSYKAYASCLGAAFIRSIGAGFGIGGTAALGKGFQEQYFPPVGIIRQVPVRSAITGLKWGSKGSIIGAGVFLATYNISLNQGARVCSQETGYTPWIFQ